MDEAIAAEHCGSELETTNNRMELVAVPEAIRLASAGIPLEVMTDSRNAVMLIDRCLHAEESSRDPAVWRD